MAKKSIAKNYIFNASYQILALLVPLITTPYISRVLQASGIGVYSFTFSIVSYFTLFAALGTVTYSNRIFGVLQDNIEERTKRFWDVFCLRLITSGIALAIYLPYAFFMAEHRVIAIIQALYLVALMFDISWYFQGMEEFKKIAIRNYAIKIINIIYVFLIVKTADDLWKYVFGLAFLTVVGNLSIWAYLPKYVARLKKYKPRPFYDFKTVLQLFVPSLAIQVYAMLDKSMIGWITGISAENGYYEQSEKVVKMCLMLVTSLSTVMIPRISKAYAENRKEEFSDGIYNSYNFVWLLSIPLALGLIGIAPIFVPIFFGPGYEKVEVLLLIFSLLFVVMGLNSTTGSQYLITTGQQNVYTKIVICGGIVNVVLNLLLIPHFHSAGAAIASVFGEIVITVLGMLYIKMSKQFSLKRIFSMSKKYVLAGVVMLIYLLIIRNYIPASLIGLLVTILSAGIIYFVMLLVQKERFVMQGWTLLRKRFKGE